MSEYVFGFLLGVAEVPPVSEGPEFFAQDAGVSRDAGLAGVKSDQCLLQLDVVELNPGILVEGSVIRRKSKGGLERAPGLLRIAFFQGTVSEREKLLRFLRSRHFQITFLRQVGIGASAASAACQRQFLFWS